PLPSEREAGGATVRNESRQQRVVAPAAQERIRCPLPVGFKNDPGIVAEVPDHAQIDLDGIGDAVGAQLFYDTLELAKRGAAGRRGRELPRALKSVEAVQLRQRTKQSGRRAIRDRVPDTDKLPPVQTGAHVGLKALRELLQQIVQETEMSEADGRTRH